MNRDDIGVAWLLLVQALRENSGEELEQRVEQLRVEHGFSENLRQFVSTAVRDAKWEYPVGDSVLSRAAFLGHVLAIASEGQLKSDERLAIVLLARSLVPVFTTGRGSWTDSASIECLAKLASFDPPPSRIASAVAEWLRVVQMFHKEAWRVQLFRSLIHVSIASGEMHASIADMRTVVAKSQRRATIRTLLDYHVEKVRNLVLKHGHGGDRSLDAAVQQLLSELEPRQHLDE